MCGLMEVPLEVSKESPDQLEFLVAACPYGYNRRDQEGVCDAVMDLDRTMVKLCGGSMVIEESIAGRRPQVPGYGQESLNDRSSTVFSHSQTASF